MALRRPRYRSVVGHARHVVPATWQGRSLLVGVLLVAMVLVLTMVLVVDVAGPRHPLAAATSTEEIAPRVVATHHDARLPRLASTASLAELGALLASGIHPDSQDAAGRTALQVAAATGRRPVVTLLLLAGADANAVDQHGRSALHAAASGHDLSLLLLLLRRGYCDVNLRDLQGRTALMLAVLADRDDMADALLVAGANPRLRDARGQTAAEQAMALGNWRMAERGALW